MATAHLPPPPITLTPEGPVHRATGDIYFSKEGAVAESRHVFLAGNGLPARLRAKPELTIAELGFGTGVNFLVTWQALQASGLGTHLHYVAIEQAPPRREMLQAIHATLPELASLSASLIAAWPQPLPGCHRLTFPAVTLTLLFGDVATMLPQIQGPVDAWYLDGFAPAKNSAMWHDALWPLLAARSAAGATLASFTAASAVRRGLQAAGFTIEKRAGFGRKREMILGQLAAARAPQSVMTPPRRALVIGAGIAGASVAWSLARRGVAVTVLERGEVAQGPSGNPAGVLFPPIPKRWSEPAQFYFSAYSYVQSHLAQWAQSGARYHPCGMLRLARDADEEALLLTLNARLGLDHAIAHGCSAEQARAHTGVALQIGGAYFPGGTWLEPATLCHALLSHAGITTRTGAEIIDMQTSSGHVCVTLREGETIAGDVVILAAGLQSAMLAAPHRHLALSGIGGQISRLPKPKAGAALRQILCQRGYIIPATDAYWIGATYDHDVAAPSLTADGHRHNRTQAEAMLPGWWQGEADGGRASLRATTPDRLPLIGRLGESVYISAGHGSRGLLSGPLGGEILASLICQQQPPLSDELLALLDPARPRAQMSRSVTNASS